MQSAAGIMIFLLQISLHYGQRSIRPSKKNENPIDKIQVKDNFNPNQFAGKWFLIGVASPCEYLKENNHRIDATIISVSPRVPEKEILPVSTFRKLDGLCWEIKQEYQETKIPGRFLLKVRGYNSNVHVLVGDTNYSTYAILYYQKQRKISIKLYARNENVPDNIIQKFEQLISDLGIPEDFIYYFPKYVATCGITPVESCYDNQSTPPVMLSHWFSLWSCLYPCTVPWKKAFSMDSATQLTSFIFSKPNTDCS